ncbi:PHP domain-containing protein [Desulfobacterales bacterium HSG17]|nr:PHP domain-containing protein [Desulfobacterales bacterium HSG17]
MIRPFTADLHIHTCLSPCGDWEMSPKGIITAALRQKLDIIAICDHNTADNIPGVMAAARDTPLTVLPGMEICSAEEVHILGIFETVENAQRMQSFCFDALESQNQPEVFGYQIIANENNEVIGECEKCLIDAIKQPVTKIVEQIHLLGGLAIASHINRPAFGILGQLGFIPPDLSLDALEIIPPFDDQQAGRLLPHQQHYPRILSSDAHYPVDIGKRKTTFYLKAPFLAEIRLALAGKEGRHMED